MFGRAQIMKLFFKKIHKWPKLAWVASYSEGSTNITVQHGPCVETSEDWCAEAVWAGDYKKGDFDRTDLVFGSGIRCRDDRAIFVSSGSMHDRLFYCKTGGSWYLSNSFPGLLACAKISLKADYLEYANDIGSIWKGIFKYKRLLPALSDNIHQISFHNLVYDGKHLKEMEKPDVAPHFDGFDAYFNFLIKSANKLKKNFDNPHRNNKIIPLASISSGYDSPAAAVIAQYAGCNKAVTIKGSAGIFGKTDSGYEIAKTLKMKCQIYEDVPDQYKNEITFWAAAGIDLDLNLSVFDYPEPLCVFFSGFLGDKLWDRKHHNFSDKMVNRNPSGYGFSEFRLHKGVFHCVVPSWGARHAEEIYKITISEEMRKWCLMNDYDRPIARRIIEQANVQRGAFATRKKFTTLTKPGFYWPYSKKNIESFRKYLRDLQIQATPNILVPLYRFFARFGPRLKRIPCLRRFDARLWSSRFKSKSNKVLFQWANSELKKLYEKSII